MEFVKGYPALKHRDYLIISDLHLGLERELEEKGYMIPDLSKEFEKRIKKIKGKTKNLLMLGDIKHSITYEDIPEVKRFIKRMEEIFEKVIIVKGNHDGGLKNTVNEYTIDNIKFIHGHMWPKDLKEEILVMGHSHPSFTLPSGRKIPCWWIGHLNKIKRYKIMNIKKVIVVPSFNEWIMGYKEPIGPLMKYLTIDEILSLDLVKLS